RSGAEPRHRGGEPNVCPPARRGSAGDPLHHLQPVDRDPRGMAEPRTGSKGLNDGPGRGGRPSWDEYSARWATLHLGLDPRKASPFVRTWLRLGYTAGRACVAGGLSAMAVTAAGVVISLLVPLLAL